MIQEGQHDHVCGGNKKKNQSSFSVVRQLLFGAKKQSHHRQF